LLLISLKDSKIVKVKVKKIRCLYLYLKNSYQIALPYNQITIYIMEEYLGMIKLFAGNFAPRGWADCNGQLLQIQRFMNLYTLLETTYGGDGVETFGLPNLMGRVPVGLGQLDGNVYSAGVTGGKDKQALTLKHMPAHNHNVKLNMSTAVGDTGTPAADVVLGVPNYPDGRGSANSSLYNKAVPDVVNTSMVAIDPAGEATPDAIDLRQPYMGMRYIICVEGIYPSRP
jgi:microcystin-dependent protein